MIGPPMGTVYRDETNWTASKGRTMKVQAGEELVQLGTYTENILHNSLVKVKKLLGCTSQWYQGCHSDEHVCTALPTKM